MKFVAPKAHLKRSISLVGLFSIATGAMISSGLFILPGYAYSIAGPAVIFSYLIAGLLAFPTMLSKAELATAMPRSGGVYYFIDRAMGPMAGTLSGLSAWFSLTVKTAFAFVGIRIFAALLLPGVNAHILSIAACFLFTAINLKGAGHAGKSQIFLVVTLLLLIGLFDGFGLTAFKPDNFKPMLRDGFGGILTASAIVFVSFGGLTKVTSIAEEVNNPGRNIPLSMFLAILVVTFVYFASVLICVGVLDSATLINSKIPVSDAAKEIMGNPGFVIMTIAAILAFLSTANAGILAAARFPFAMSRDKLLPSFLSKISYRNGTPWVSILLTGITVSILLLFSFESIVKLASAMKIFLFLLVNIALIIMRESRIHTYKPIFRSPGYPWVQIFGIVGMTVLLIMLGKPAFFACLVITVGGTVLYFAYSRKRSERESALLHLAARVFPRELRKDGLIKELAGVLKERDHILEDRFDRLIDKAVILDIDGSPDVNGFFDSVAQSISTYLELSSDDIVKLLLERERESTTALRPGLAIPHIIVPGENKFVILLARCRHGIDFDSDNSPVKMVFVLAGTKDERNFHLKALMAIAELSSESSFDSAWMKCRNTEEIRDMLLLAKRKRSTSDN